MEYFARFFDISFIHFVFAITLNLDNNKSLNMMHILIETPKYLDLCMINMYSKILDMCDMNLWGVVVLELDCHPDHNKGTDHAPCAAGPKPIS